MGDARHWFRLVASLAATGGRGVPIQGAAAGPAARVARTTRRSCRIRFPGEQARQRWIGQEPEGTKQNNSLDKHYDCSAEPWQAAMKNPFALLAASVQNKIKAAFFAMQAKFRSESDTLKAELLACRNELRQVKSVLVESEDQNKSLHEDNYTLGVKFVEIKKAFFFLQSTSSNALKVQKLIDSYKRIKVELLELRRTCDCSVNESERLQQEIDRHTILSGNMSSECKVDLNSLIDTIEILKKELSQCKCKNDSLERLVANVKRHEQKLANFIKSKQVL